MIFNMLYELNLCITFYMYNSVTYDWFSGVSAFVIHLFRTMTTITVHFLPRRISVIIDSAEYLTFVQRTVLAYKIELYFLITAVYSLTHGREVKILCMLFKWLVFRYVWLPIAQSGGVFVFMLSSMRFFRAF